MVQVRWFVEGIEFGVCNCAYGCPCQFEALPTEGRCHGFEVVRIDRGRFGEVKLDGLRAALLYAWPGPIFEGGGSMQAIIDERADSRQRDALVKILHGKETNEAATHWWVYHAMSSTVHPPLFKSIDCEIDIEARRARVAIPGTLEASGAPIKSPATGQEHRARIDIPNGIEFELAEIGSGTLKSTGAIALDIESRYGQFNVLRHSNDGVVH
jgi:hypothetical protein